jgi:hypothetical protein
LKYVAVATLALLLGFAIGWAARLGPSNAKATAISDRAEVSLPPTQPPPPDVVASDAKEADRAQATPNDRHAGGLISEELARYARDEIAAGWGELRKDPIPDATRERGFGEFEEIVKRTPREIGRKLAEKQTDDDTLAGSDLVEILRSLDRSDLGPQLDLVRSEDRFPSFFKCAGGPTLDGPTIAADPSRIPRDSATLLFGPGVHKLRRGFLENVDDPPHCLTLAGVGMNQTMLVIGEISVRGVLDRFAIRDCTVFTNDAYLFDLRREPALIELDRVRLCGFDMGAGSSSAFDTRASAILARDSRFEGGYGRSPGGGVLFDIRTNGFLARFDRCTMTSVSIPVMYLHRGATVLFSHCAFEQLGDKQYMLDQAPPGVVFDACSIQISEPGAQTAPAHELDDLFPDWRALARR